MFDDQMNTKECFFFDAGNTLIRLHPSREELLLEIVREHGMDTTLGQLKVAFMLNDHMLDKGGFTVMPSGDRWQFWILYTEKLLESIGLETNGVQEMARSVAGAFCSPKSWTTFQDVFPTLERLRRGGCRMAVISNAELGLRRILEDLGIAGFFETIVMSEELGVEKPDPTIFQEALERVDVAPEKCVHTGDMIEADVKGARSVGITPVWLDRQRLGKYTPEMMRIDTLADLPAMFRLPNDVRP